MTTQIGGYWGKLIEVDMTTGKVEITDRHMQYVSDYIGGHALGSKLLWEALKDKPGIDPMGPENVFMILPGPLGGIPIPGGGSRYNTICKSAMTQAKNSPYGENGATVAWSAAGGKFGPTLKMAGFDGIYVTGASATPKVLYVNNGEVELLDGSKYWGMSTHEFEETIQNEYGPMYKNCCVGPAAENGVRFACVMSETGRANGRGGTGAVMASKKLKGVIVNGTMPVPVANKEELLDKIKFYHNTIMASSNADVRRRWGTGSGLTQRSNMSVTSCRNHREGMNPYDDKIGIGVIHSEFWIRHRSCYGCPWRCMKIGVIRQGEHAGAIAEGPEYESAMNGANWLLDDMGEFAAIMEKLEGYGFDLIGLGGLVGYALEAYENGVITSKDIDGIKLEWSNGVEIMKFMDALVSNHTNPIYDWFRRGSTYAALKIDAERKTDSVKYAMDSKNHSFAAHNVHGQEAATGYNGLEMGYAVGHRGACHINGVTPAAMNNMMIRDMGVFCSFSTAYGAQGETDILNFIMGTSYTLDQMNYIASRARNIEKVFNLREGFTVEDDTLPWRTFNDPYQWGPKKGALLPEDKFKETRKNYYTEMGWDPETGIPTKGKLQELGLEDLIPYLPK
ncbi:MAG: hypothetical protein IJP33_00265 [Firmicutes bacterium]|nr:hypothetical protein [Bacillota bacterium]